MSTDFSAGFDIEVNGKLAGIVLPEPAPSRMVIVNRIIDGELEQPELNWLASENGNDVPVRTNFAPEWTLEGCNTAYLMGTAEAGDCNVVAAFNCPLEGLDVNVTGGQSYTFQALFGLHRAKGFIRLSFMGEDGGVLQVFEKDITEGALGGQKVEDYALVSLSVQSPVGAATLRTEIVKSPTVNGTDSFLFFTRPALTQTGRVVDYDRLENSLPDSMIVDLFRIGPERLQACDIAIPGEALDGGVNRVALRNRLSGSISNHAAVLLPSGIRFKCTIDGLEGSTLVGNLQLPSTWSNGATLSLSVDGQVVPQLFLAQAGHGAFRIPLPPACCDGRPHVFELRLGKTGQILGQFAAIGPVGLTPWDALQKYAGMPLPAHISPLAAHRYASFNAPDHVPQSKNGPGLGELHDIIVEGFDSARNAFRPLPFPKVDHPDVSIVIPAHNKFDVTYVCLAALLFAATKCSFEVIVVDDGSNDTTTLLPGIAPGVTYVRNDSALGFVGACNAGAAQARGHYITFLNNDTEPTAYWLDELLFVFENFDDVGLAGSKLIYPDGPLQEAGGIVWETGDPWNYGRRANPADPRYSYSRICDYLSGAAIMIPAGLWTQLGGFSREFAPAYFEDTDLAFKVRNAGKKVVFAPASLVVHYEGLSNGTDKTAPSGLKRFQEINRPKFKRKWSALFSGNGKVGKDVDLAKDRGIAKRVVFFDTEFPSVDRDAGSYAAVQEIRMFQAMGCKVTFVPLNMAYLGRYTFDLQRIGVETIHSPFYPDVISFLKARGSEFDLAYITRYGVADQILGPLREHARQARVVVNVADLHFLRQIREAIVDGSDAKLATAMKTREEEISVLSRAELVLSYSNIEQAVITSHVPRGPKARIVPWVIDPIPAKATFRQRQDVAFLGGFGHPPNLQAVKFFAEEVMPLLRVRLPGVRFLVYGSGVPPEIEALACEDVIIKGYVRDVAEVFQSCRVFVAPLLSGAGMKGKVLDCISAGLPSVLSPVAAEGIGLRDGFDTIIASHPEEWAGAIARLYEDESTWTAMSKSVRELAKSQFSFAAGVEGLREALASIEFFLTPGQSALCVNTARPKSPGRTAGAELNSKAIAAIRPAPGH